MYDGSHQLLPTYFLQIGEITFRNHYTWAVGVHVLRATSSTSSSGGVVGAGLLGGEAGGDAAWVWKDPAAWQVGVRNKVIMPHPHTETASHDFVSITCLEVREDICDIPDFICGLCFIFFALTPISSSILLYFLNS